MKIEVFADQEPSGTSQIEPNGVQVALGGQFEAQNGVQVALGVQFEGQNGVQVALGGQFEGPSGVQVAVGGQLEAPSGVQEALLWHFKSLRFGTFVRLGTAKEGMIVI